MRYNKKSVTVITDHQERWNVSPVLLRRAEPRDITPTNPEPVDLFPRQTVTPDTIRCPDGATPVRPSKQI